MTGFVFLHLGGGLCPPAVPIKSHRKDRWAVIVEAGPVCLVRALCHRARFRSGEVSSLSGSDRGGLGFFGVSPTPFFLPPVSASFLIPYLIFNTILDPYLPRVNRDAGFSA